MLNANRSTFKPSAGSCQTREYAILSSPTSVGLGASADANFDGGDNFNVLSLGGTTTFVVPKEARYVRIYAAASGAPNGAACITYSDPCSDSTHVEKCPSTSACCPTCDTGLCCDHNNGTCTNGICEDDCTTQSGGDSCWRTFDDNASPAEVEDACKWCNKCACCDAANDGSGYCNCTDPNEPPGPGGGGGTAPRLCFDSPCDATEPVASCDACDDPGNGTWNCGDGGCEEFGDDTCVCVEAKGEKNVGQYGSQAACESRCGTENNKWRCCPDEGCVVEDGDVAALCNDDSAPTYYCTRNACEKCCKGSGLLPSVETSAYANSVIPSYTTSNLKVKGDSLSSNELTILNRGAPSLQTASNITKATADAYNSRLLHANLIGVFSPVTENSTIVLEQGETCNVCHDGRVLKTDETINCGSSIASMFYAEYDLSELCSDTIEVIVTVSNRHEDIENTSIKESLLEVRIEARSLTNDGIALGETYTTLLVDPVESGYVIPNSNAGTIDCDSCGITFDCDGTIVVNGGYPTIVDVPTPNDISKYNIPSAQHDGFPTLEGKLQNARTTNHTLEDYTFNIITTVLAVGSQSVPIYTSAANADMIDLITGGPADHTAGNSSTTIATKLVGDSERVTSQSAGNTYINGSTNSLQNHYGLPGMASCAVAGEYATPGEGLFAAIFTGATA